MAEEDTVDTVDIAKNVDIKPESGEEITTSVDESVTTVDQVTAKLEELGVDSDMIKKIKEMGAEMVKDLAGLQEKDLTDAGMPILKARKLIAVLVPTSGANIDPNKELADNEKPSSAQVTGFAGALGIDPTTLMLLMNGQGGDMDLSSMISIDVVVNGYNPKLRNMFLMIMGQIEERLGVPIVVIDSDGAVNRSLTAEYIEGLEESRDSAENNIYFDIESVPHEVINVGVDAQSIYDADPLMPDKALQKSGMGTGRVNWNGVPLEVRQVAYFAVTETKEIKPTSDGHQTWLRGHMKPGVNRLIFHGRAPQAISAYNEAARTGSLPTLRVMLSRNPRSKEIMPRRRKSNPSDLLTGIGSE
ncbi:MAG: hypothetical protein KAI71_00550 [Candidatus Pacebacteria bacterium]|nr:hypothetical protein [Candidatus Paceibacterota bacterium]